MLTKWDKLPDKMRIPEVREYYNILNKKKYSLLLKRIFDVAMSLLLLIIFLPFYVIVFVCIKLDSKGSVIYKQKRITQDGKEFDIFKFRTMVENAENLGTQITLVNDVRITKVGSILRKYRIDETLQLINILKGEMSFVGARPEVKKYVDQYTTEMLATLLLPAGVTSVASIKYKDESKLLNEVDDVNKVYIEKVLPKKMNCNLQYIKEFSFWNDIKIMFITIISIF